MFLVLYAHSQDLIKGLNGVAEGSIVSAIDQVFRPGWWGVRIFFALSGYLIGRQVLQVLTDGSLREGWLFIARRWIRTVPTFWIVLGVTAAAEGIPLASKQVLTNALFINTATVTGSESSLVAVGWSLVIEEWSYAALGAAALLVCAWRRRLSTREACICLVTIAIISIVASSGLRLGHAADSAMTFDQLKKTASLQLDSLAYGILLACIAAQRPKLWDKLTANGWVTCLTTLAGMSIVGWWLRLRFQLGVSTPSPDDLAVLASIIYPVSALLCCCLCLSLWRFDWKETGVLQPAAKPVQALSRISYSVYLTHLPIKELDAFKQAPANGSAILWVGYLALSIGFGYLCWHLIERPFMVIRRRLH